MRYFLSSFQSQTLYANYMKTINHVSKWQQGLIFLLGKKHIALKYHHFRSHVKSGRVDIYYRPTGEQKAEMLTKPLSNEAFFTLRCMLCGWGYSYHLELLVLLIFTFPTQHRKLVIFDPTHHNKLGFILPQHHKLVNFCSNTSVNTPIVHEWG